MLKTVGKRLQSWSWRKKKSFLFPRLAISLFVAAFVLNSCAIIPKPEPPGKTADKRAAETEITSQEPFPIKVEDLPPLTEIAPQTATDETMPFDDKLFSFSARSTPLRDVLLGLAKQAELNLVISKDVDGLEPVSVEFKNLPLGQSMEEILRTFEYSYEISGNILRIKALDTRIFNFDYPLIFSKATSNVGGDMLGSSGGGGGESSDMSADFSVNTEVEDNDSLNVWKQIKDLLQPREEGEGSQKKGETTGLLSTIGSATVNSASGTIVVTDRPDVLHMVEDVLAQMQNALKRQVIIEAKIMEVTLNHSHQYGVDWSAIRKGTTLPFDITSSMAGNLSSGTGTFQLNISKIAGEYDLGAMIDAISTQGDVNTISSPRINVINNQSATISIGRTIPYLDFEIACQDNTSVTNNTNITDKDCEAIPTVKRAQAGVSLGITPQISGDGVITLHVIPVITEQVGSAPFSYEGTGWTVPILDTRTASTIISALDNETIVLGGLIQDNSSDDRARVPILGSIPGIGPFLFGNQARQSNKKELVILLTPRIVKR